MFCTVSLVPTHPVTNYPICGKDLFTGSIEAVAHCEYMHMYPIPESDTDDQTQYMTVTDAELEMWLRSLDTEPPTAPQASNDPIPNLLDIVQVAGETTLKNDNSQDSIHSGTMEPGTPKSPGVPKPSSHEDNVLVAGKATCEFNLKSDCKKTTRAKSSSGCRTGGRKEGLQSQPSKRDGGRQRAGAPRSGERMMGRGFRTDKALDAGQKPPTKRRRDDDIDEEGSTSRVGKRKRTL